MNKNIGTPTNNNNFMVACPLVFTVDVPRSEFGVISENQITIGGKFTVNESNHSLWNSVLTEINALLIRSGLKV
jgi:hypothetical protein